MGFWAAALPIVGSIVSGLFGGSKKESSNTAKAGKSSTIATTLDADVTNDLGSSIRDLLAGGTSASVAALSSGLSSLQSNPTTFDRAAYVKGTTDRASAGINDNLEGALNGLFSGTGTGDKDNSMAALLANRLRRSSASELAGVEAQAEATGAQIESGIKGQETSSAAQYTSELTSLLSALVGGAKGAVVTEDKVYDETAKGSGKSSSFGFNGESLGKIIGGLGNY